MHLPADGHLRCLRVGAVVNEAAVNLCERSYSVWTHAFVFVGVCGEVALLEEPCFYPPCGRRRLHLEMRKLRPPRGEVTCQRDHTAHKC